MSSVRVSRHSLIVFAFFNAASMALPAAEESSPAGANSMAPRLTVDSSGTPWLSWLEKAHQDPNDKSSALKYSAYRENRFEPARTIAVGDNWFVNWADTPHLFVGGNGAMLAHWLQKSAQSPYAYDIKISYSNNGGANWSTPLTPHKDGTHTEHGFVSFYPAAKGVGMVWLDGRNMNNEIHPGPMTLRGAVINTQGQILDESLLDGQVCDCCQTAAAMTHHGPVVVYRNRGDDEIRDIAMVHKTKKGWSEPIIVHQDNWNIAACPVNGPQIISLGNEVAVVWFTMAGGIPAVHLTHSINHLTEFAPPYTLARATPMGRVALALSGKHLAVAWIEELHDTAQLKLAWIGLNDFKEITRATVSEVPSGRASGFPTMVGLDDDDVLLAWTQANDQTISVVARRVLLSK